MMKAGSRLLLLRFLLVAGCSTLVGRLVSTSLLVAQTAENIPVDLRSPSITRYSLYQQTDDQREFQEMLLSSQNPTTCATSRFLVRGELVPKDGFASEVQYIARLLQISLSTGRILWITDEWKSSYCPALTVTPNSSAPRVGWACLWKPTTRCPRLQTGSKGNRTAPSLVETAVNPMAYAVLPRRHWSEQPSSSFDPLLYISRPMVAAPMSFPLKDSTPIADVIPHWERVYGRFWIRSQMVHYLWKPAEWMQNEIQQRLNYPKNDLFVGLHVRYTDNIPDFAKGFGRNATWTRELRRFHSIAERLRREHKKKMELASMPLGDMHHVYIATDHSQVVEWARTVFAGWTIWSQDDVQRSTSQRRVWFAEGRSTAAGAMATDLEALRRADYLIGSFQSNVFRLAAELNTAWNVEKYSVRMTRHFSVDVEWYEDP